MADRIYKTKADAAKMSKQAEKAKHLTAIEKKFREALKGCMQCDYDEAECGLHCHRAACQLKVTSLAWRVFMQGKSE